MFREHERPAAPVAAGLNYVMNKQVFLLMR